MNEKTMAQVLEEKGLKKGRKEGRKEGEKRAKITSRRTMLLRLAKIRFGEVPADKTMIINASTDLDQLDQWLDRLVVAETLDDLDIKKSRTK